MVEAGGGPSSFNTVTLLKMLTGPQFDAEVAKLTKQYGKEQVGAVSQDVRLRRERFAEDRHREEDRAPQPAEPDPTTVRLSPARCGPRVSPVKASTSR